MISAWIEGAPAVVDATAAMLAATGDALWSASLNNTPNCRLMWEWMRSPRLGDLVVVLHVHPSTPPIQRVGVWRASWTYHLPDDAETVDTPYRDMGRTEVFMIEQLDGELISWSNTGMARIPRDQAERRELN